MKMKMLWCFSYFKFLLVIFQQFTMSAVTSFTPRHILEALNNDAWSKPLEDKDPLLSDTWFARWWHFSNIFGNVHPGFVGEMMQFDDTYCSNGVGSTTNQLVKGD